MTDQPSTTSLLKRLRDRVLCALQDRPEAILWPRRGAPRALSRQDEAVPSKEAHDPMAGW